MKVLFENQDLIAFEKPNRVHSVPGKDSLAPNATEIAQSLKPELAGVEEAGLIYRLDFETSGVLLFAKNSNTHRLFREHWTSTAVQKLYRAVISETSLPPLPHLIETPIAHSPKSTKRMIAIKGGHSISARNAKKILPALTEILSATPCALGLDLTLRILTGFRHQIRIHLQSLGCPVIGDSLYSKDPAPRLYLHCERILTEFPLPELEIHSPTPEGWPS